MSEKLSKGAIGELISSTKNAIALWIQVIDCNGKKKQSQLSTQIKASKLEKPLDDLTKITTLMHAHGTKLGIVFKAPIPEENYHACFKELEGCVKTLMLFMSLFKQLVNEENKYSHLFIDELTKAARSLLSAVQDLLAEMEKELNNTESTNRKERLISVGKIWQACKNIDDDLGEGPSGIIKKRLKETNRLIKDADQEYEEWLENPSTENYDNDLDDAFGIESEKGDAEQNEQGDNVVEEGFLKYAKGKAAKLRMIRLLIVSLNKSIPSSRYNVRYARSIDLLDSERVRLAAIVDDFVAAVVYDQDMEEAVKAGELLQKQALKIAKLVSKLNEGNKLRTGWLETWQRKFTEEAPQ